MTISRPARLACLTASFALLGGCAVSGITQQAEELPVPEQWARGGSDGVVASEWIASFGLARLESLVSESMNSSFSLQQERERLAAARAAVTIARAGRLPVLDLSLDGRRSGGDDGAGATFVSESYELSLGGRWDADPWQRLGNAQKAAELALAAQQARLVDAERALAGEVASRYFDVLEAEQLLGVARRRLDNAMASADIVDSGYRQGLNDALDLYLARNQVERERAALALQEQNRVEAIADLQLSLARYPDGQLDIDGELPVIETPIPTGLPSELLTRRPDIQAAWLDLLAADADLAAAHKARFPSLLLVGSRGESATELSALLDDGVAGWSVAFGLTQPLFEAGRLKALEGQALAQVRIAEQAYLDLVYRAFASVENEISRSVSLAERYAALLESEKNSRAALELALEQYQRGLVTYTTVLESQRQAFDAESTVVQLANQRLQNRIALYLALSGDFGTGETS